jgi:aspartate ammonia-lyase
MIRAMAMVKLAAARANHEVGAIDERVLRGIEGACRELIDGRLHEQFAIDCIQGGAGTSTNMNANEVIANRALELMGHAKGEYEHCHPNDHVNLSQSTNDAYPSALHIAVAIQNRQLVEKLRKLVDAFRRKGTEFGAVVKMGRTQLQDAVPMTLGQEFTAFGGSIEEELQALEAVERGRLHEINMGGTAIGTGLNAAPGYAAACARHLAEVTGMPIVSAPDLVEATQDTQAFVLYASALKSLSIKLSKICNDLRLLSSGPRAGSMRSTSPRSSPAPPSCPERSTPSSPR